jgi:hypothetical protein
MELAKDKEEDRASGSPFLLLAYYYAWSKHKKSSKVETKGSLSS